MTRTTASRVRPFVATLALGTLASALVASAGAMRPAAPAPAHQDDPLSDIRAKDAAVRQGAALDLAADASDKATSALVKAARGDDDLLVVLAAIEGLSGRTPSKGITKGLVEVALESPFSSARTAAARVLGASGDEAAAVALLKKCTGKTLVVAGAGLATCLEAAPLPQGRDERAASKDVKKLSKALRSKEPSERPVAARAMVALSRGAPGVRAETLGTLVLERLGEREDVAVVCAALDSVCEAPVAADASTLLPAMAAAGLTSVVERRLESAMAAALGVMSPADAQGFLTARFEGGGGGGEAVSTAASPVAGPRLARALAAEVLAAEDAALWVERLLGAEAVDTRAAAGRALRVLAEAGSDEARASLVAAAVEALDGEFDARVQLQLVRGIAAHADVTEGETLETLGAATRALVEMLEGGGNTLVREAAAVALGEPEAAAPVVRALSGFANGDAGEDLTVTAAVALGRTRAEAALEPLVALL
ncbi:MAG: hypothetical protein PVJ89_09645, partial [Planctomycetota bacterium]